MKFPDSMWSIPGKSVSPKRFEPFEPADVLYEFDGPRIFTLVDSEGELNLAYWSDEDDQVCLYIVVPTTCPGLKQVVANNKLVPVDHPWVQAARGIGISLGDGGAA